MLGMQGEATLLVSKPQANANLTAAGWTFKNDEFLLKSITDLINVKKIGGLVIYIILLSLAMLAIFDTQILSIFRRQKEIGTYIAMGMTRGQVVTLFTLEGSMNSVLAGVLAALYGIPLLAWQASKGLSFAGVGKQYGMAMADRIFPAYSLGLVLVTVALIMLTTTIVSYMPSRKIASMNPTEALRGKLQ